jgi:WD40 repeat protein
MRKKISIFAALIAIVCLWSCRSSRQNNTSQDNPLPTKSALVPTSSPTITAPASLTPTKTSIPVPKLNLIETLGKGHAQNFLRSPDGSKVFLSNGDNIDVLDGYDYHLIKTIPVPRNPPRFVSNVNNDGSLLILNDMYGFDVLEVETGKIIGTGWGGMGSTSGESFTDNDQYVLYSANDHTTGGPYHSICKLDLTGEEPTDENTYYGDCFPMYDDRRYSTTSNPAISPNGKWVAAGYSNWTKNEIFVWDIKTKEIIQQIGQQPASIQSVEFTPDGSMLISAGDDGVIRFWNVYSGRLVKAINAFSNNIGSMRLNNNKLMIYVRAQDKVIYDLATGKISAYQPKPIDPYDEHLIQSGYTLNAVNSFVRFSPSREKIAYGDGSIQIWDAKSRRLLSSIYTEHSLELVAMTFSNDENMLAAATTDDKVYVWEIESGEQLFYTQTNSMSARLDFIKNEFTDIDCSTWGTIFGEPVYGKFGISFSNDDTKILIPNGRNIDIWDIKSNQKDLSLDYSDPPMLPFKVSASIDGKYIYSVMDWNQNLLIQNADTGKQIRSLPLPDVNNDTFTATDLSNKWFVRTNAAGEKYWIEVINIESGKMMKLPISGRDSRPIRLSNTGEYIGALHSNLLTIWEIETGQIIYVSNDLDRIDDFSIDDHSGMLVTLKEGKISLWDLRPFMDLKNSVDDFPGLNTPMPPTPTPDYISSFNSPTPAPTIVIQTLKVPETSADAIDERNSKDITLLKTIGLGEITVISYSSENTLYVTSSNGFYELDGDTLEVMQSFEKEGVLITGHQQMAEDASLIAGYANDQRSMVWKENSSEPVYEFENTLKPVISPDGKWLVLSTQDEDIFTWNLETNTRGVNLLNFYEDFTDFEFSPDSKLVAGISENNSVRIWDVASGTIINGVGGSEGEINDIQFSANSQYLVGAAGGEAWIWSVNPNIAPKSIALFEPIYKDNLSIFLDQVSSIAINPANSIIAVGTSEHEIHLYNLNSETKTKTFSDLTSTPKKIIFSPDGRKLVVADIDGQISIFNIENGDIIVQSHIFSGQYQQLIPRLDGNIATWISNAYHTIDADSLSITSSTHLPTDRILAGDPSGHIILGYEPYQVSIFDEQDGKLLQTLTEEAEDVFVEYYHEGKILQQFYGALFSQDGNEFITFGTGGIWQYSSPNGKLINYLPGNNTQKAALTTDGKWLMASLSEFSQRPFLIDLEKVNNNNDFSNNEGRYLNTTSASYYFQYVFHPDKSSIVILEKSWDEPSSIKIVSLSSLQVQAKLPIPEKNPLKAAYSPDGKLLAVGMDDGGIMLLDSESLEIYKQWDAHSGSINAITFTTNGKQLFSAGLEGTIKVWGIE